MSKRTSGRVPATRATRGGWKHINSLLYEINGATLADDERIAAALPIPGDAFDPSRSAPVVEVRGGGSRWTVFYPNEKLVASAIEVYGPDGQLKDVLLVHGGDQALQHTRSDFESTPGLSEQDALAEALEYASRLRARGSHRPKRPLATGRARTVRTPVVPRTPK
jgi:hypothetical protein